jgi:protein-glutamine gamma-glutamyltransferase
VLRFAIGASAALMGFSAALKFDAHFSWAISSWAAAVAVAFVTLHRCDILASCPSQPATPPATTRERSRLAISAISGGGLIVAFAFIALIAVPIPEGPVRLLSPSKVPKILKVPSDGGLAASSPDGEVIESTPSDPVPSAAFGYSAFAASFDLSQRGRPGNDIVMRVRAPAPDFWRAQTFETFDGQRWTASPETGRPVSGPSIIVPARDGDATDVPTDQLVQTYMLEQDMTNLIFAASRPTEVMLDADVWIRPDGALRASTVLTAGTEYTVISERAKVTDESLRMQAGPGDPALGWSWNPPGSERYLQLSPTTTDRVRELTRSITDPYPDVYDKVRAIEAWLAANVEYDLAAPIPPEGSDAVDHFVFDSKRGFCEQIATTLVVMLRTIGVPARVAAGYIPGERDPFAGVWVVREGDAHAWAEVWFPATGWQAFDPTAVVPFAGDTAGARSIGFPIVATAARFIISWIPTALPVLMIALATWAAVRWLRLAVRGRRDPAWAAQRRFEQVCRRLHVPVTNVDTNESLAAAIAERQPDVQVAAAYAAASIDAATFGSADPAAATRAVNELAHAVPSAMRLIGSSTPRV